YVPRTIVWYVAITNVGVATLVHSTLTDVNNDIPCVVHQDIGCMPPGSSTNILLCTLTNFTCSGSSNGFANTIFIASDEFTLGACTNALLCTTELNGSNIVATTECSACLRCIITIPAICRVTGGGRQDV